MVEEFPTVQKLFQAIEYDQSDKTSLLENECLTLMVLNIDGFAGMVAPSDKDAFPCEAASSSLPNNGSRIASAFLPLTPNDDGKYSALPLGSQ